MGVQTKGPNGKFRGLIGTMIGYIIKGRQILTGLHDPSSKPPTQKQMDQRRKFGLMTAFVADASDMVDIGFKHGAYESATNAAVSYNLKNAITGVSPNYTIDFSKVLLSSGSTDKPAELVAVAEAARKLKFTWTFNGDTQKRKTTDKLVIMVFCPVTDEYFFMPPTILRSALTHTLTLPSHFAGQVVHCYLAFLSETGIASDSAYKGPLTII